MAKKDGGLSTTTLLHIGSTKHTEGEVHNSHSHILRFDLLENLSQDFALNVGILDRHMSLDELGVLREIAVNNLGIGRIVTTACGSVVVILAELSVLVIVDKVLAGQSPNIKQRIGLATELEHIGVHLSVSRTAPVGCDKVAYSVLLSLPLLIVLGVKVADIFLGESNSLFDVDRKSVV